MHKRLHAVCLPHMNDTRLTTNQGVTAMTNTNTDIKQIAGGNLYD